MGHARALITIDDVSLQLNVFHQILKDGLSVRKVEELVRNLVTKSDKPETEKKPVSPEISKLQERLSSHFGTKIRIKSKDNKGEINIPYTSTEDLNRILDILDL